MHAEMGAKRRQAFPQLKLLEVEPPRAILAEVLEAVIGHLRGQAPLVLAMPSARNWLMRANVEAGGKTPSWILTPLRTPRCTWRACYGRCPIFPSPGCSSRSPRRMRAPGPWSSNGIGLSSMSPSTTAGALPCGWGRPLGARQFHFAEVPVDARPELVLESVAWLKGAG